MSPERSYSSLSIVLPGYNESGAIKHVIEELDEVLRTLPLTCEIIVVDDGSTDGTYESALSAAHATPLKVIKLSRNFGKEAAMTAGLEAAAQSDAVIIMDADGQHSPSIVLEFVKHWRDGYDIVYAKRMSRLTDSWLRRSLSNLYYKIASRGSVFIEPNSGDLRLLSAQVVKAILSLPEKTRFMKGIFNWIGFKKLAIEFSPRVRAAGETKFSFRHLFRFGILGIMSFSTFPLRLIARVGFLVAGLSVLYGITIMTRTLVFGIDVPGWATLAVALTLLSGIQLISIGVVGEYVGLIFTEVKNRPLYIVEKVTQQQGNLAQREAA